jgi:hypothetical protein
MPASRGNQYAAKGRRWATAIERALAKRSRTEQLEALDDLAEVLLRACDSGDLVALKELGDRLDGRPKQALVGEDGGPVRVEFAWLGELPAPSDNPADDGN